MECVDLLGSSSKDLASLIGAARAPTPLGNRRPKGRASRLAYDEQGILIAALRPAADQDITAYKVRPLNISATGIAFLHGAFVYPGTECSVIARGKDGVPRQCTGHVVRCRMIQGRVHEIGMRFDEPIDISELVDGAAEADEIEEPDGPILPQGEQGVILKGEPKPHKHEASKDDEAKDGEAEDAGDEPEGRADGAEPEADAEDAKPEADAA